MEFIEKIQSVIQKPKDFFTSIKKEKGIKEAFKYYLYFVIAISVVYGIYLSRIYSISPEFVSIGLPTIPLVVISTIGIFLISLVGVFIGVGIVHLFVKLVKGKNPFSETFKAIIYADTPRYLLSIIILLAYSIIVPRISSASIGSELGMTIITTIVSIPVTIWSIYLRVISLAKLQNLTTFRAFSAVFLIPLGVGLILVLLAVIVFMTILSQVSLPL